MIETRVLDVEDAGAFREIRLAGLAESPLSFGSSVEEEQYRGLPEWAQRVTPGEDSAVLGAFLDRALVGVVRVVRESGVKQMHRASIASMYVAPEARRRGVASALMERAMSHVQGWDGVRQVELAVTAGNSSAIQLYQRFGFVEYGRAPAALRVEGEYHDELLMIRLLS